MSNEGLVLDGLALNDENPWRILDGTFQFTPAKKKLSWAGSALADGSALVGDKDHYENAEMTFRVRMEAQDSPDTAQSLLNDLTTKLQKGRDIRGGLPLTWTPANSGNTQTLYVLDAEYDELPSSYEEGWTTQAYQLVVHLYLRPFIYGFEQSLSLGLSDSFEFDSLTNGGWRFDAGTGTLSVSSGKLLPSTEVVKRLYRPVTTTDATVTMRLKVGSTVSGGVSGAMKRVDASNYLRLAVFGSSLLIGKATTAGGLVTLATASYSFSASTFYWLQASLVGNDITLAAYADSQNPLTTANPTVLASASYTLSSGAEANTFGEGIRGNPGIYLDPPATNPAEWVVTDYSVRNMPDIRGADPILGFEIAQVDGQVDAEGRLVVTEGSSQDRAHIEWGLEARNYDPTVVWPLLIDSDSMLTASFAGNQATVGIGAYDPNGSGTDSIQVTNISETVPLTVCSFGSQAHVGAFKVKARVLGTADVKCRLSWRIGDGQPQRNDFSPPLLGVAWQEIDLGTIIVPEAGIGDQSWTGRLEAVGVSGGGLTLDYVEVIPLERYGVARAPLRPITPTVYSAFDNFNQTAGVLHNKTLTSGQTWLTSGATGDFSVVAGTSHNAQRTATGDVSAVTGRYAVAGSTNYAGVQVQADVGTATALSNAVDLTALLRMGVLLRYNDANNWLMAVRQVTSVLKPGSFGGPDTYIHTTRLVLIKRVASVNTTLGNVAEQVAPEIHRTIICQVDAAGVYQVYSFWPGTNQPAEPQIVGQDSQLSAGAAPGIPDGKIGIYDVNTAAAAATRTYDNFTAFDSQTSVVMYSGRSMEVRADRTERESSSGSQWGRVPMYRGDRLLIPPTGDSGQVTRMAVKARRNDVDGGLPDNQIADSITVAAFATPRFLVPS